METRTVRATNTSLWADVEANLRLIIAAYLLGQMLDTPANTTPEESAKERKVRAAFAYADLLLNNR
jgi:hypothetical protein